ncbi:MAG TPA: hypothetical protein VFD13_08930 [Candidatus Kapabacteria bacterium]|nr:hypothetical protein [Candidatus Kapabacteria bacterium]
MTLHAIPAHLVGDNILLDKPVKLDPEAKLWLMYSSDDDENSFRDEWSQMAMIAMEDFHRREEQSDNYE